MNSSPFAETNMQELLYKGSQIIWASQTDGNLFTADFTSERMFEEKTLYETVYWTRFEQLLCLKTNRYRLEYFHRLSQVSESFASFSKALSR